ncbi:hypothetical protein [Pseudonocardia sp. HH130630-07]|uniref:hypothetical protein n=1 Tax=Pseudonocardia sp. HH130630-07 TaxID=1690815 RepID=UPI0012E9F494|nr:hypothetical protein [Pseudonocardia sp. HH130630-07]
MPAPAVRIPSPRRPVDSAVSVPPVAAPAAPVVTGSLVPAPRTAPDGTTSGSGRPAAPRHALRPQPTVPAPRAGAPEPGGVPRGVPGRHRGPAGPTPLARSFAVLARAGSLTTLAAMVVLAAAVVGLADGSAPAGDGTGASEAAVSDER